MKHLLIFAVLFAPCVVLAAGGLVPCNGPECTFCHLVVMGQRIINFLAVVVIPLSAIGFAAAGFIYMTSGGSQEKVKRSHGIFLKVFIGLVVTLGAWLIVTLIFTIARQNFNAFLGC